jgi:hypothetical protein
LPLPRVVVEPVVSLAAREELRVEQPEQPALMAKAREVREPRNQPAVTVVRQTAEPGELTAHWELAGLEEPARSRAVVAVVAVTTAVAAVELTWIPAAPTVAVAVVALLGTAQH